MTTGKPPGQRRPYIPSEVAAMFGVNEKTVGRWRKTGKIPYFMTIGGHARYPADSTDALLRKLTGGRP